jgi:hypothetical protein
VAREERIPSETGAWDTCQVTVSQLVDEPIGEIGTVASYERLYPRLGQTFEPFRQGGRDYALVSANYQWTSVLDLETGEIVAEEKLPKGEEGFCPVAFFVPDWWDVHGPNLDEPGKPVEWEPEYAWPIGQFGLVYGTYWGAPECSIQYLDLSQIKQGAVNRDNRFGDLQIKLEGPLHEAVQFNGETRTFRVNLPVVCRLSGEVWGPFRHLNVPAEYLPPPARVVRPTAVPASRADRWIASKGRRRNKR